MDNINEYINQYDTDIQIKLNQLRQVILETDENIIEKIAWGVPTYSYHGFLVQFAVSKNHIGFYCSPAAIQHFHQDLIPYQTNSKNTIRFLNNQDIPYPLIKRIVQYRIIENKKDAH